MNVLVVGGAGYIGSHVCKALQNAGFKPIIYDNLQNGHPWAVKWGFLVQGDLLDPATLDETFQLYQPIAVIHLASLIDCRESSRDPGKYYRNNVVGTLNLLEAMVKYKVDQFVFSSTAAVYGKPQETPITENHPLEPINVYGKTKKMVEEILTDYFNAHQLRSVSLRYFNASGADEVGEAHEPETHLIPLAILAALGKNPSFKIFGNDHTTPDGTPIRDYIHVSDLADAHVKALQWLIKGGSKISLNLGSAKGYSVREVVDHIEKSVGAVPREIVSRNPADPPVLVADISAAKEILKWMPVKSDLATIISSAAEWHKSR